MSTYKVIQDIEAEDKLIGPLTLRQSIYAGICLVCLYICFISVTKHVSFLVGIFLPPALITGFFAFPWKGEQPTEIWALARLRFMIKPRVRIWNQSGVKDVVTITAPRKIEASRPRTNNLSEYEVRSRLKALADTIDSRGWATRNASYTGYIQQQQSNIVAPGSMPLAGIPAANDMFDERGSMVQNLDAMLTRSSQNQRQRVLMQMAQAEAPASRPGAQTVIAPQQGHQLPQPAMPAMPFLPPTPNVMQGPQLPAPVMPSALPALPPPIAPPATVTSGMAGNVAPLPNPADFAAPAEHLQSLLQQPAPAMQASMPPAASPTMPATIAPVAPAPPASAPNAPANDYWFAGADGSAPASNPLAATPAVSQSQASQSPAEQQPQAQPASLSQPYAAAISSGKIMTDVPVAAAVEPSADEQAFAEAARGQSMAQQLNYSHMKVVQPAGASTPALAPSVPGMIDYGRPQPVDDQMQYDTSLPQSKKPATIDRPPAKPVTRKPTPAILDLAKNDDLDVATIARQANKEIAKSPNEVEVRLH